MPHATIKKPKTSINICGSIPNNTFINDNSPVISDIKGIYKTIPIAVAVKSISRKKSSGIGISDNKNIWKGIFNPLLIIYCTNFIMLLDGHPNLLLLFAKLKKIIYNDFHNICN